MNPSEVPADFLLVAEQLSHIQHSQKETYITLIKHAFQSTLGTKYPLHSIHRALQVHGSKAQKSIDNSHELFIYILQYNCMFKMSFVVCGDISESQFSLTFFLCI